MDARQTGRAQIVKIGAARGAAAGPGFRAYEQKAAGSPSSADQLASLRDRGVVTVQEFDRQEATILAA
jgi:hypothetical protein